MKLVHNDFYKQDAPSVAKGLLGTLLVVGDNSLIITETEAYLNESDLASHARFGRSKRSAILFEEGGILYVYLIYGMHYCTNIVVGEKDFPSAVLLRAGVTQDGKYIKGPGNFSKYLGLDRLYNGIPLTTGESPCIYAYVDIPKKYVHTGPRINVGYAGNGWAESPLRYWIEPAELKQLTDQSDSK